MGGGGGGNTAQPCWGEVGGPTCPHPHRGTAPTWGRRTPCPRGPSCSCCSHPRGSWAWAGSRREQGGCECRWGGAAGEGILQGSPLPSQHAPRELPLPLGGHSPDGAEHRLQVLGAQLLLQHGQAEHLSLGGLGAPPCSALGLLVPVEAHRPPQHRQDSCTAGSSLEGGVCASQPLPGALPSGWDSRGAGLRCGSGSPGGGFLTHEHLPISPFPHFPQTETPLAQQRCSGWLLSPARAHTSMGARRQPPAPTHLSLSTVILMAVET